MYTRERKSKILYVLDDAKEIPIESMGLKLHQVWFMGKAQKRAKSVLSTTYQGKWGMGKFCTFYYLYLYSAIDTGLYAAVK